MNDFLLVEKWNQFLYKLSGGVENMLGINH